MRLKSLIYVGVALCATSASANVFTGSFCRNVEKRYVPMTEKFVAETQLDRPDLATLADIIAKAEESISAQSWFISDATENEYRAQVAQAQKLVKTGDFRTAAAVAGKILTDLNSAHAKYCE